MTKIKKTFLTLASALLCALCLTLAILGVTPKKNVFADAAQYETATVYDVSQLSASGPSAVTGDAAWFNGKTLNSTTRAFDLPSKGYAATKTDTTYTSNSIGVTLNAYTTAANKWSADNKSAIRLFIGYTEVRWYYRALDGGFKFEVFDHAESGTPNHAVRVNNGATYYTTDFDSTVERTYKVVKSMVQGDSTSYHVDIYIGGTLEYTADVSGVSYDNTNATLDRFDIRSLSTTDIVIASAFADTTKAKDVYDYRASDEYLMGKAFTSKWDDATNKATANADVFDRTNMTDVSADSFGVTFKVKFNSAVVAGREVLRARIGSTYDVRLSIVTAGAEGKAQINAFDWRNNSNTNKILGAAAYQFSMDLTKEHTYSFIKEKIEGTTSGYVYSAYVDGTLIQRAVYNVAPAASWSGSNDYNATNRMRISIQNGNYTGTFSSAKYYGVKVDGDMQKVNVGETYTLVAPETDKLFFGFKDSANRTYKAGETVNVYTELTSVLVDVHNEKGAYVRFLHQGSASLKWVTYIDKADLAALQAVYGTENVSIYRKVKTANDTSKEINKQVAIADMVEGETQYSFAQILSNVKQSHYEWNFVYSVCVEVKDGNGNVLYEVEVENEERSISYVAKAAYDDVKTAQEYNDLSEEQKALYQYVIDESDPENVGKYSKYSKEQRNILKTYFTAQ